MTISLINPELVYEIYLKIKKLEDNPDYYKYRREKVMESLSNLGDLYSFWIEHPDLRKDLLLENKQPKTIKKLARKGLHRIKNAWNYLSNLKQPLGECLNEDILKKTNQLIEPDISGSGDFRTKDVSLGLKGYTPPSFEKLPEKVSASLENVLIAYKSNPLEGAIKSHYEIAKIQPFMDGNKRTARIIQNKLLYDKNLPPAVIPVSDSKFYFDIIRKSFPEDCEGDIEGTRQFYDYCASKVNEGLDQILDDLKV